MTTRSVVWLLWAVIAVTADAPPECAAGAFSGDRVLRIE
jgi:hypothetical protein